MINLQNIDPNMIANNITPSVLTHPGEVLREELEERGITQTDLAKQIGIKVSQLNEIINCKRSISATVALLLEAALGVDADLWLNMQKSYDKGIVKQDKSFLERLAKIRNIAAAL